ncbi:MAG: Crp/Fnr family transcriptional regulator [Anaerolineae bacterium]|nr:Crp/Fnr family transcriptional regulator [Anaerolineae bacterium]
MIASFLRQVPYFAHLSDQHLEALAQQAIRRRFDVGEIIFTEGSPSAGLWILEAGNVKAYKLSAAGNEYILRLLGAGDTFNDIAALDGGSNPANAAAIAEVTAWVIPTATLHQMLATDRAMALAIILGLAGRVRHLVFQMEDLALRSVTSRLARFLLEQAENPALTAPAVTRTLIAAHLATTPETVSRALRSLEEMGAIQFDRHRILIVKADLLHEIALL